MAERRHRPALDHMHAGRALGPGAQAFERKLRPPAQPARHRREPFLEGAPQAGLGADVIDQDDFAAGPRVTRANSSSVASGSGTVVITYCATTTSK